MTEGPGEPSGSTPAPTTEPTPPAGESSFSRLGGVLFSPDETFASIERKPDWLVPLLLFMGIYFFRGSVFAPSGEFAAPAPGHNEGHGELTADQSESPSDIIRGLAKGAG